jgi:hypothetical protein
VPGSPAIDARLLKQGVDIVASSPGRFHDFPLAEIAKWAKLIVQANIRTEASQ